MSGQSRPSADFSKRTFRDAHERRAYLRAVEIADLILADPEAVLRGRAFLERFMRPDPRQKRVYELWRDALASEPHHIAARLLADNDEGARLRESAPVFGVITPERARSIMDKPK